MHRTSIAIILVSALTSVALEKSKDKQTTTATTSTTSFVQATTVAMIVSTAAGEVTTTAKESQGEATTATSLATIETTTTSRTELLTLPTDCQRIEGYFYVNSGIGSCYTIVASAKPYLTAQKECNELSGYNAHLAYYRDGVGLNLFWKAKITEQGSYWIGEVENPSNNIWTDQDANGVYGAPFNNSFMCSSTICKGIPCTGGYGSFYTYGLSSPCMAYFNATTTRWAICEYDSSCNSAGSPTNSNVKSSESTPNTESSEAIPETGNGGNSGQATQPTAQTTAKPAITTTKPLNTTMKPTTKPTTHKGSPLLLTGQTLILTIVCLLISTFSQATVQ